MARKLNITASYQTMIETGRRRPSIWLFRRMCAALEDPHLWAAAVGGVQIGPEVPGSDASSSLVRDGQDHRAPERLIPVVGHVSAGPARIAWTDAGFPTGGGDDYVSAHADLKDPHAFALRIKGDSMVPSLRDGDIVIISPRAGRLRAGEEALVQTLDGKSYLKAVYPKGSVLILQSLNQAYEPIVVSKEQVRKVMRVVDVRRRR